MIAKRESDYPIPYNPLWNRVDPSKVEVWLSCPRLYFFQHVLGWKTTKPNNHLAFGTAMHLALEHMLNNKDRGYGRDVIIEAFDAFLTSYRSEGFSEEADELYTPKTPANMLQALIYYAGRWEKEDKNLDVLYTEVSGSVPISSNRSITYKIDAIVQDQRTGNIFTLEHKSGSRITRQWEDKWALHNQPCAYTHVLYSLFDPKLVKGVKINGIHFIKRKTNPVEFIRLPCWKRPSQMGAWLWEINNIFDEMKFEFIRFSKCSPDDSILKAFPKNPESCTKYFGCPFHDFCCAWSNPLSRADEVPHGYEVSHWDPMAVESPTTTRKDISEGYLKYAELLD